MIYHVAIAMVIFFTCENNMLFSGVNKSCFCMKAHLVFIGVYITTYIILLLLG